MSRGNWFNNRGAATATERHIVSYGAVSKWFILLQKLLIRIIFLNNPVKKNYTSMILQINLLQLKTSKSHQNNYLAPAHSQESLQMT